MANYRRELVNRRARDAVRDFMSGTTLGQIDELWQDELFAPVFDDPEPVGGQRVTHFQGYLDHVDWTDPSQVARALRVFEAALSWLFDLPMNIDQAPSVSSACGVFSDGTAMSGLMREKLLAGLKLLWSRIHFWPALPIRQSFWNTLIG
ncbi:hypothetical protein [Pseudarthrobacter sp. NPDC057230]|uniref:hypothetical protein n=1 Tax=Pseudarthrobacter sp. NPDC057230 TaxID=3346057 RepID=UPI00363979D2